MYIKETMKVPDKDIGEVIGCSRKYVNEIINRRKLNLANKGTPPLLGGIEEL